jgi:hypothetical protein
MGTLYYMAPEQMKRTHTVDHRADLYSLGVVFYEMLTGELPMGRFAPPSHKARVDARLDPVVLRALAREPELRYQDAAELKREVESVTSGSEALSSPGPGARPGRVRAIGNWPSVRFTIPHIFRTGGEARGEIHRDDEALIVEFKESWGMWRSGLKEVRIPFHEITSISCQSELLPDLSEGEAAVRMGRGREQKMRKWAHMWEWLVKQNTQLVIKVARPEALAGLPVGKPGKGRLMVPWGDRTAAKQLVDSIVQQPLRDIGRNDPRVAKEGLLDRFPNSDRTRMEITMPAVGLLFTGIVAALSSIACYAAFAHENFRHGAPPDFHLAISLYALCLALCAAGFVIAGSIKMMRLRSYAHAVAATMLVMAPWSPAWIFGLPFGIWGLMVLRRPEVQATFLGKRGLADIASPERKEPKNPSPGKMALFFRSVAGYMLPSFAGRNSPAQPGVSGPHVLKEAAPLSSDKSSL